MHSKYGFDTTETRSRTMSKIKSSDTKIEIEFRKALWNLGYRYRKNYKKLPGKPDIVFVSKRIVVFIDGEFWHGYRWKEKKKKIKNNREYWIQKIEKNIKRDKENNKKLKELGWSVIRYWEHEIRSDMQKCVEEIIRIIQK